MTVKLVMQSHASIQLIVNLFIIIPDHQFYEFLSLVVVVVVYVMLQALVSMTDCNHS